MKSCARPLSSPALRGSFQTPSGLTRQLLHVVSWVPNFPSHQTSSCLLQKCIHAERANDPRQYLVLRTWSKGLISLEQAAGCKGKLLLPGDAAAANVLHSSVSVALTRTFLDVGLQTACFESDLGPISG